MGTVLVVDDEPPIVALLRDMIEDAGHIAVTATNGLDGLVLAQRHQPSLIISDVMMPVMDGYTLLRELRDDRMLSHTMVILMSAHARTTEMYDSSATAFTLKPLDLDLINSFLQRLS